MVTYYMRTSADANSTDAYLPKTTEEKAGCPDPDRPFAAVMTLETWQPYPTGGSSSGTSTNVAIDTEPTYEVPNLEATEDTRAPILSAASVTPTSSFAANATITTDEANGVFYMVTTTSATPPSITQIKLGQDHTGAAAIFADNDPADHVGAYAFAVINLVATTSYWAYFVHEDAAHNQSSVSSAAFATAGDAIAPILTGSSGTVTGPTTATVRTTTDENNGTLYVVVSTSATKPTATQIKAGQNHLGATVPSGTRAISSIGLKAIDITGLTAATTYYAHFVHQDVAANQSNIPTATAFTTSAASGTAPVLANQTLGFGRLTKVGHMSVQRLVNTGGAITSATIDSGNTGTVFQISSTGVITPLAALGAGPYTLGCTFTNASGSDTATITVPITANEAWVSTTAEMTALSWTDAAPTARIVKLLGPAAGAQPYEFCDPGNTDNSQQWWKSRAYTSWMTVGAISTSDLPVVQMTKAELGVGYTSTLRLPNFMRFEYIDFYAPFVPGEHLNTNATACLVTGINLGGLTFSHCKFRGNSTALGFVVTPGSTLVAGNNVTINLNGVNHSIPFHTDDATTMADIATSLATNPGVASAVVITRTGQTGVGNLGSRQIYCMSNLGQPWQFTTTTGITVAGSYDGVKTMNRSAPWRSCLGFSTGNVNGVDLRFEHCEFYAMQRLSNIGPVLGAGRIIFFHNEFHDFNADCIVAGASPRVIICYNYMHGPFAQATSSGHGDFLQWTASSAAASLTGIQLWSNISSSFREDGTDTKHEFQGGAGGFCDDVPAAGIFFEGIIAHHNVTITNTSWAVFWRPGKNCYLWRTTSVRDPAAVGAAAGWPIVGEEEGQTGSSDPVGNNWTDNIMSSVLTIPGSGVVDSGNIKANNVWSTYLTGPIGATYTSKADIIAKLTPKAGYTTKGAVGPWTDFATFSDITGAPWGAVATLSASSYTTTNPAGTDIGIISKGFDPWGTSVITLTDNAGGKVQLNADGVTLEVGSVASTAGTTNCTIRVTDEFGRYYSTVLALTVSTGSGDVTAPVLSTPVGTKTGSTTATLSVSTNEGNGNLHTVCTTSSTPPSKAQVKLGQDHTGANAPYRPAAQAISTTGSKSFSATGLAGSTTYWTYFMHEDAAANQSNVAAAASFTTDAGAATAAYVNSGHNGIETGTTVSVTMPASLVAGNKLLLFYSCGLGVGNTPDLTAQGFTLLDDDNTGTSRTAAVWWKTATGSETAFNITQGTACHQAVSVLQFSGGSQIAAIAVSSSTQQSPDTPNLTPAWGSAQNLWGTLFHEVRAGAPRTVNTVPAGYTVILPAVALPNYHRIFDGASVDVAVGLATKVAIAASEDPAAWVLSGTSGIYGSFTFALTPG